MTISSRIPRPINHRGKNNYCFDTKIDNEGGTPWTTKLTITIQNIDIKVG